MTDLVAFIEARLAEDEQVALAASGSTPRLQRAGFSSHWHTEPWFDGTGERCVLRAGAAGDLTSAGGIEVPAGEHAARHDPARVLREVAATLRLLAVARTHLRFDEHHPNPFYAGFGPGMLEALAAPYTDHPDYRTEWAI